MKLRFLWSIFLLASMALAQTTPYRGQGTLANRPSPPPVNAGVAAYYCATDTGDFFYWTGVQWLRSYGNCYAAAGNGISSLNGLTGSSQTFATNTSGTDFTINSSGTIHTFQLPTASASNRGLLSSANWSTFNDKQSALSSNAGATHEWISSFSAPNTFSFTQPASTDLSDYGGLLGVPAFLASGSGHAAGLVPDPGASAGSTRYLREDASWDVPAGGSSGSQVNNTAQMGPAAVGSTGFKIIEAVSCENAGAQTTISCPAFATAMQSGDQIIAVAMIGSGGATAPNCSDNLNGAYTSRVADENGGNLYRLSDILNSAAGTATLTCTVASGNSNGFQVSAIHVTGITSYDTATDNYSSYSGVPVVAIATRTTAQDNEVLIAAGMYEGTSASGFGFVTPGFINPPNSSAYQLSCSAYNCWAELAYAPAGAAGSYSAGVLGSYIILAAYRTGSASTSGTPTFRAITTADLPSHTPATIFSATWASISGAISDTLTVVPMTNQAFLFRGNAACTASGTGIASLDLKYKDVSNTAITVSSIANCAILGAASNASTVESFTALGGSQITYGVSATNTPIHSGGAFLQQEN